MGDAFSDDLEYGGWSDASANGWTVPLDEMYYEIEVSMDGVAFRVTWGPHIALHAADCWAECAKETIAHLAED